MTLDLAPEELDRLLALTADWVRDYFRTVDSRPIAPPAEPGSALAERLRTLSPTGVDLATLLDDCAEIFDVSRHNGHPRFFGYIASPATPVGAAADLLASVFNANVASRRGARGPTEIELAVVDWLGGLLGFAEHATGLFTSGGSAGNMQALFIASRHVAGAAIGDEGLRAAPPLRLYVTSQTHHSVAKAADILGFGRAAVRVVPCDEALRMDVEALRTMIRADRESSALPFCVVGSAGTTNTGAVDPLALIADVASAEGLWFHVDGAYGAPATLDPLRRQLFTGIERADSLSVDAHKWLYTAVDCSCLLLRDLDVARRAFAESSHADYIRIDDPRVDEAYAFFDHGIELTRRFRALKLWMTLRYYGTDRIAAAIAHDCAMATRFGTLADAAEDLELMAPVELGICCLRYRPADGRYTEAELDELNQTLLAELVAGGEAYLSNASVRGRFALRACVVNYRTTEQDVDRTVAAIRELGARLSQSRPLRPVS